jgi:hypothetical protein
MSIYHTLNLATTNHSVGVGYLLVFASRNLVKIHHLIATKYLTPISFFGSENNRFVSCLIKSEALFLLKNTRNEIFRKRVIMKSYEIFICTPSITFINSV